MRRSAAARPAQTRTIVAVGAALTSLVLLARPLPLLEGWERRSIDLRFARTPGREAPLHPDLCFVDIDNGALDVGGRWPWPRERLARAIGEVARAGARTIVLDLLLTESEAGHGEEGSALSAGDAALGAALRSAATVVSLDLGDEDVRSGGNRITPFQARQEALRRLQAERGGAERELVPLADFLASQQPADPSVRLGRREIEQLATVWDQERSWRLLRPLLAPPESVGAKSSVEEPRFAKAPIAELAAAARGVGFVNFSADRDGALRVITPARASHGKPALQLGIAAALVHLGLPPSAMRASPDSIEVGTTRLPIEGGELWLHWPTPRATEPADAEAWLRVAPHRSLGRALDIIEAEHDLATQARRQAEFARVLADELGFDPTDEALVEKVREEAASLIKDAEKEARVAPLTADEIELLRPFSDFLAFDIVCAKAIAAIAAAREEMRATFEGKLVFVGWTATGAASDFVPTPLAPRTPGVVAHAVTADMVLTGRAIRLTPAWIAPLLTALLGLAATAASLLPLSLSLPAGLLLLAGHVAGCGWAFASGARVVPLVAPLAAAGLAWIGSTALQMALARRDQRRVTRQFKARVGPELVDWLVDNPDALSMRGEPRDVTCFFVDLAGFTSLSEKLGASPTVALLNRCMGATTGALTRHGAYVNKFLGDGLMAFWSAFRPDPDQATLACRAALAAQEALTGVIDPRQVSARMGIASGRVIVGDCGAPPLLNDYTAIGDAINLSSRLESANKQFGTRILVDGRTRAQVTDPALRFRPLGRIVVVGQATPVDLFELVPATVTDEEIELTGRAVAAFQAGELDRARSLFEELARRFESGALARPWLDAITTPRLPFDGVLHLASK